MNLPVQIREDASAPIVSPLKFAHFVLRTSRYAEMIEWYKTVLGADITFTSDFLTFLAYDDEHHRVALIHVPGLADQEAGVAGVHHTAFTYASLHDLLGTYARLRDAAIKPIFVINHGPTTSLYYADPDGNQIELQVDNFDTVEEAGAFFYSPEFAENPVGVEFDPEDFVARLANGEAEAVLKRRPNDGARNLADIKLR